MIDPNTQPIEDDVIQHQIDKSSAEDQFGVANIPLHTHNGSDANRIDFKDLQNRLFIITHILPGTEPATAGNYNLFFTAPFQMRLQAANLVFSTLGTDGSAVTLQIEHLTLTTAPGSGTSLLGVPFNLKAAINTVQYGSFAAIKKSSFILKKGDRLALVLTGTPTAVANLVLVCTFIY